MKRIQSYPKQWSHNFCTKQMRTNDVQQIAAVNINNLSANRLLKNIYSDIKNGKLESNKEAISNIFDIYHQINEPRNHFIINTMLRLCFDLNSSDKLLTIWKDIELLHKNKQKCKDISYPLLLKCCMKSDHISINKCIQALKWMNNINFKLQTQNNLIIKLITKCNDIESLKYIHSMLNKKTIESTKKDNNDIYIETALIKAYGNVNDIKSALNIFNSLNDDKKDTICINAMLQALINNDRNKEAINLYERYGLLIDDVSLGLIIKAYTNTGNIAKNNIIESISKCNNVRVQTNLIEYYGNNGDINNALNVYNSIAVNKKDIISICVMMKTYLNNGFYKEVLQIYHDMDRKDDVCHLLAIKACTNLKNIDNAAAILQNINMNDCNINMKNALIEMYGVFGDVETAENIYKSIGDHDQNISTNTMMKVYVNNKYDEAALKLYDMMEDNKIEKDDISHIVAIQACTKLLDYDKGTQIHSNIAMQIVNIQIKTALMNFYGNCRDIQNALNIFKSIADHQQTIISIGAMMDVYCKNNNNSQCIQLFKELTNVYKIKPNIICYSILFKVCSNSAAYHFGKEIHENLKNDLNDNWILQDIGIQTNLINFYGKCGRLDLCQQIFENQQKNTDEILLWNAMIYSYGKNGKFDEAKHLFNTMKNKLGTMPNSYAILFNLCGHFGNVEEAKDIWNNYIDDNDIKYDCYVVSSFVDCLSRNGFLDEAIKYIEIYENYSNNKPDHIMWISLLNGCNKYENKELQKYVYQQYLNRFGDNKIYRRKLDAASVLSEYSEIDIFGEVHKLYGDSKQNQTEILEKLALYGYNNDIDIESIKHSETMAVLYGLMNTPKDYVIVVNKNLNICDNCHRFMALLSQIEQRKLIISDKDRVHIFENGNCCCY